MGMQTTKLPTRIVLFVLSLVVTMTGMLGSTSVLNAQTRTLLPRFTNTVQRPVRLSPSVNMRLKEGLSTTKALFLPSRFRRQDGDLFGEDQASEDPFGEAVVESPIQESPFQRTQPAQATPPVAPRPRDTQIRNPFGEPPTAPRRGDPPIRNPFGEPEIGTPVVQPPQFDPSPRTPPMDTVPVEPRLPAGGEFTPEPGSVPDMPTPNNSTRETDKARSAPSRDRSRDTDPRELIPGDPDGGDPDKDDSDDLDQLSVEEEGSQSRRQPSSRRRGNDLPDFKDDPRRPFRSNVYRPAPDPTYYTAPTTNPNRPQQDPNTNAPYPNPYANPYAAQPNPYGTPYATPYANPYANPYAPNPYLMNPYAVAGNGLGCPPCNCGGGCGGNCGGGCGGCGGNCGGCNGCGASNNNYANCPSPTPAGTNDVYNSVVGDGANLGVSGRALNNPLMPSGVPLYYLSLFGGWSDLTDLEIANETGTNNLSSQNGLGLGIAFGQIQGKNLRSELEFSYRSHDIDDLFLNDGTGTQTISGAGDIESFAGMLNVYWEFTDLCSGRLSPYIGAGVGAVNANAEVRIDGGQDAFSNGEDSSFAYQYMVGINYKVRNYSDLFIEYRHFAADSLRLDTSLPAGSLVNGDGELNYQTNNIFFGMRLKF